MISIPAQINLTEVVTPAQIRVLYLLANGKSVKEITVLLKISRRTVSAHISNARCRLGAQSRDETMALAVQQGLLNVDIETLD